MGLGNCGSPPEIARIVNAGRALSGIAAVKMLQRIRGAWQFLRYFIHARKIWRRPGKRDVLIFDALGEEFLLEYLAPWQPEVLHVRGEQLNMPALFTSLFRPGRTFDAYVDCYLEQVRPRLVITFFDNNPRFYSIAARHRELKTMFIQNGTRGVELFAELDRMESMKSASRVDYMMTLGSRIGVEYAKHVQGSVVPIGSLINNLVRRGGTKKPGAIAFISQYRDFPGMFLEGRYRTRQEILDQPDLVVLAFLVDYAQRKGGEFFIVPCTGHSKDPELMKKERAYFNDLLQQTCVFPEWRWRGSSYEAVDSAEVVVGIDSTLVYESAARGNKTAIFSIRSQMLGVPGRTYGWPEIYPDDGPYWTNRPDPVAFERILDHLFAINDGQWQSELSEHDYSAVVAYDPGNTILRKTFQSELGSAPDCIKAPNSATRLQ
jgi:surface carbohydrate biosynthesis protein